MRQVHLISQLFLQQGVLRSRVKSSAKKVHFRQGELDGACGAYSIAMALNIVGAFDADYLNKETEKVDFRTAEGKLHKAIHNGGCTLMASPLMIAPASLIHTRSMFPMKHFKTWIQYQKPLIMIVQS